MAGRSPADALTRGLGGEELKAASWIARCRDWHARAILTIARTTELDDLDLRFPLAFRRAVESPSVRRSLPPAAVYAVIRQESAFMSDARSSAGALGLMQIMPRTGREIARAMGRRLRNRNELLVPRLNVEMGTHYLRSLLREVDGHIVLATASYNAGPHRVRRWLPAQGEVEAAVWIDSIPFTETRRYVRRVLAYHAIYEHRLGQRPTRLSERMPPVPSRAACDRVPPRMYARRRSGRRQGLPPRPNARGCTERRRRHPADGRHASRRWPDRVKRLPCSIDTPGIRRAAGWMAPNRFRPDCRGIRPPRRPERHPTSG